MIIALDAFGSDNAPLPEIEGALLAIEKNYCDKVILVGNKDDINKILSKKKHFDKSRIEIVNATEVVLPEDEPSKSFKHKKDSSMKRAIELHKEGKADAVISAGNTGATMAISLFSYGRIKGIARPAIAVTVPTITGDAKIILDVGANPECQPEYLLQFAELGSLYSELFYKKKKPRISLLNIGEEAKKGNELTKQAYKILAEQKKLNFVGNEEGKDLLKDCSDVVVCDGFTGNIVLKTLEGIPSAFSTILKEEIKKKLLGIIGAILMKGVFKSLKKRLSHSEYGGALLVGLNGLTIIAHGRADSKAFMNAINFGSTIAKSNLLKEMKKYFIKET